MTAVSPKKRTWLQQALHVIKRDKCLLLMFLPFVIYYVVFKYVPMTGIVIAFKNFKPGHGIYYGKWVGMKWFIQFFNSPYAFRIIRNTVLISLYSLVFGFPVPILFAVCVNEIRLKGYKRVVQTVSYLPHFFSTVVVVGMIYNFFSVNNGIVNSLISGMGGTKINFLNDPNWFRPLYVGSGIWQSFGFSSIIYIAAIGGIDPSLYEAGKIDGITRFKQVWYITLPMIMPTIIVLFILQIGRIMSVGFEKVYLLYNSAVLETADVISTYVYRQGIQSVNFSSATAIGLFNSVVNFLFVFSANQLCKKLTEQSLW